MNLYGDRMLQLMYIYHCSPGLQLMYIPLVVRNQVNEECVVVILLVTKPFQKERDLKKYAPD